MLAPMSELVLVRHGETEWSRSGRHTGRTDLALTARGEEQARALASSLASRRIAHVFVSPLQRARRTAELAGLTPSRAAIAIEPGLMEWDYGAYEGRTKPEILAERPGWNLWRDGVPPGEGAHPGESVADVVARADAVIERARARLADEAGDVVLVAHGHALRMVATRWLGLPPEFGGRLVLDPATLSVLRSDGGAGTLVRWNAR